MIIEKEGNRISVVDHFTNKSKLSQTKTTRKMIELMEIQNAILRHKDEPQLFMIALLTSFVVNARSVTMIMQKEYAHTEGFKQWYNEKQKIMIEDKNMLFFSTIRPEIVHNDILFITRCINYKLEKDTDIGNHLFSFPSIQYKQNGNFEVIDKFLKIDGKLRKDIPIETNMEYYFRDNEEKQAPIMCTDHFMKLAKIMDECNTKFRPVYSD